MNRVVVLIVGLIVSIMFLLLSPAALPVIALSMGGSFYIAIPLLMSIVGVLATIGFTRALRRA